MIQLIVTLPKAKKPGCATRVASVKLPEMSRGLTICIDTLTRESTRTGIRAAHASAMHRAGTQLYSREGTGNMNWGNNKMDSSHEAGHTASADGTQHVKTCWSAKRRTSTTATAHPPISTTRTNARRLANPDGRLRESASYNPANSDVAQS
jgi:hypothetical protein